MLVFGVLGLHWAVSTAIRDQIGEGSWQGIGTQGSKGEVKWKGAATVPNDVSLEKEQPFVWKAPRFSLPLLTQ